MYCGFKPSKAVGVNYYNTEQGNLRVKGNLRVRPILYS